MKIRIPILIFVFVLSPAILFSQDIDKLLELTRQYINVGGWITAAEWANEAKTKIIAEEGKDSERYYYVQEKLGYINTQLADYVAAEACFNEVEHWYRKRGKTSSQKYSRHLFNTAGLYFRMGLYDESESDYMKALKICLRDEDKNEKTIASIYNNLGNLYKSIPQYENAEKYYNLALKIKEKSGKTLSYSYTLNNMAGLFSKTGRDSLAEQYYLQALAIKKELVGEENVSFARTLANLAIVLDKREEYKKSEEYFLHAEKILKWKLGEDHPEYNDLLYEIGMHMEKTNNLFEAQNYYHKVLDNLFFQINEYFPSLTEAEKNNFYNSLKSRLETYDAFVLKRYKSDHKLLYRMYDNQLQTKALLLNERGKVKDQILNSGDEELIGLYSKWQKKKNEYATTISVSLTDQSSLGSNKAQLELEIQELEKQLALKSQTFKHAGESTKQDWKAVYKKLQNDEAAVEIIRYHTEDQQTHYLALVIRKGTRKAMRLVILPEGEEMETIYLNNYKNSIKHKVKDMKSYDRYWLPIQKELGRVKTVYLSPDGVYNQLNLGALYHTDSAKYLLNELNVHLVTKTSDIIEFSTQDVFAMSGAKSAVLFGRPDFLISELNTSDNTPPSVEHLEAGQKRYAQLVKDAHFPDLPATESEVNDIAGLINENPTEWKAKIYTGKEATESTLKDIDNPTVLHIATHGFFVGEQNDSIKTYDKDHRDHMVNPMIRSGLILAGVTNYYRDNVKSKEDGILTAMEATSLRLDSTQLVVLSACETGLGEIKKGEGVYGMYRALKIAGAKTILMSHWKVDDKATYELMYAFYKEWLRTGNKHEAFKIAQNSIKLKYEHPYYWGAFVMIGE